VASGAGRGDPPCLRESGLSPPAPIPDGDAFPEEGEPILFDTNLFVYAADVPREEPEIRGLDPRAFARPLREEGN